MVLPDPTSLHLATQALHDLGLKGALALVPSWQVGLEQAPSSDPTLLARDGYRGNEIVYACVREIAATAAEVRLQVRTASGAPLPRHPLQRLLDAPNPDHSPFELIEGLLTDLLVSGNAFLLKQRSRQLQAADSQRGPTAHGPAGMGRPGLPSGPGRPGGAPGEIEALWKLRPDRMRVVPGARNLVDAYVHRVGERETRFPPSDVIHFRLPDPADDLWGLAPVAVAARQIDTDTEASQFVHAFFRNAAVPFGIIKLKRALRGGEPEARRIGQRWTDRFRGLLGRFQVGVLDADAEFQRIGLTQEEMTFPELRAQTEARICAAFRVPPMLVGVKVGLDRSTFHNMGEARRFFWENTMLSLYRRIESKLAVDLTPEFAGPAQDIEIRFDFSEVRALRDAAGSPTADAGAGPVAETGP